MRSALAVIPARYASSRFPGKPLAMLAGKPMIQRVHEQVAKVRGLSGLLVATDDDRIARAVAAFGGQVAMTGDCRTGTDRVYEAVRERDVEVVLNVQGDEPLIEPACLEALLEVFAEPEVVMATLCRRLQPDEGANPNVVKVVRDRKGDALYFSRSAIPYLRGEACPLWAHIGVYAYRKTFLEQVTRLPSTPLEQAESLEQLRVLEHGFRIRAVETTYESLGVDTPEDLAKAELHFQRR